MSKRKRPAPTLRQDPSNKPVRPKRKSSAESSREIMKAFVKRNAALMKRLAKR
jgi:hypothetical protein